MSTYKGVFELNKDPKNHPHCSPQGKDAQQNAPLQKQHAQTGEMNEKDDTVTQTFRRNFEESN